MQTWYVNSVYSQWQHSRSAQPSKAFSAIPKVGTKVRVLFERVCLSQVWPLSKLMSHSCLSHRKGTQSLARSPGKRLLLSSQQHWTQLHPKVNSSFLAVERWHLSVECSYIYCFAIAGLLARIWFWSQLCSVLLQKQHFGFSQWRDKNSNWWETTQSYMCWKMPSPQDCPRMCRSCICRSNINFWVVLWS